MSAPSSNLCERCARVLEFDDSTFGVKLGSEKEGCFLGSRFRQVSDDGEAFGNTFMDSLPDLRVLSASSRDGCHFCAVLIAAIRQCGFIEQYILVSFQLCFSFSEYWKKGQVFHPGLRALVARILFVEDRYVSYLRFDIEGQPGKCRDWLRLESFPEEMTLCQKNVQWLRQNLFGKDASLPDQSEAHATPWRPLRLIDVNPKENYDCRLVANKNVVSSHSPYLALSYCWGNSEDARTQFKTKIKTIDDRMRGFLLEEVPKCIRDAVEVSRALGVRYLWVDALCILQDDNSDWEIQSSQMAQIYGNAIAVICASASSSCHQGFLERNKTSASIEFQSKIDSTIHGHFNISFNGRFNRSSCGNFNAARLDTRYSKWAIRGWTHQELYLARHAIIFGRSKIHHRCSDMVWTENEAIKRDGIRISLNKRSIQEKEDTVMSGWIDAVFYFANRQFSVISDRLPAISGLAETVSGSCPDQYLAGIRRSRLHHDLIWALDVAQGHLFVAPDRLHLPDPYIAPSWSWASRRQPIYSPLIARILLFGPPITHNSREEYSKVDTHISLIGQNPYGHVSHGCLTFCAIVVPLWMRLELDKPSWAGFLSNQYQIPRRTLRHHTGDDFSARVLLDWSPSERDDFIDDLWFFLLGSCHQQSDYRQPRDRSSSRKSKDESKDANRSNTKGSNDDSGDDLSTVLDEEGETIEQTKSTAVDDVDHDSQSPGSGCAESEGGMKSIPTQQENRRDEASSETQGEAPTSDLGTAPPSSRKSEKRAIRDVPDDLFESQSKSGSERSDNDSYEGRIAYGLIIHPTGKPGQFFRVGVWASHDFGFFRGRQESTFELI